MSASAVIHDCSRCGERDVDWRMFHRCVRPGEYALTVVPIAGPWPLRRLRRARALSHLQSTFDEAERDRPIENVVDSL